MNGKYYIEDLDSLPFGVVVDVYQSNGVPRWLACCVLGLQRFGQALGFKSSAGHGSQKSQFLHPVDRSEISEAALVSWSPFFEQFQIAGFRRIAWFKTKSIGDKEECRAAFIDSQGNTLAMLDWLRIGQIQQVHYSFNSYCNDDREVITAVIANHNPQLEPYILPPYVDFRHEADHQSVSANYALHQRRIAGKSLIHVSEENAFALNQRQSDRLFEFLTAGGILRELSDKEVLRLQSAGLE